MAFNGLTAVLSPCFRLSLVFLQPKYQSFPEYQSKSIWRSLSASCLFSELAKARHSNAFVRECLLKNAMITLADLRRPYPEFFFFFFFFWLTEACQRHGLGDFELKLFRLSKLSKESYAIQTQFQWNTKSITKTYLYNFDPLNPHFYIVKLGFTGVYVIFLISAQKHRLWYSLGPPRRGGYNEYPQSMFLAEI